MDDPRELERLIDRLAAPGALPGAADGPVEVVQTHISAVFLSGTRAFKLKKPVDFGFLDFSTRERRAHFCREELRLNRRLSPDTYLGLCPVWWRGDDVEVGPPVENPPPCDELLVAMERLPADRMMDRLLERDAVEPVSVERLARLVAAFHTRAGAGEDVARFGTRENAGRHALDNFDQTARFRGELFDAGRHARMRSRTAGFLETRERLFAGRIQQGRIRDGHGDLHSPNICLPADGRIVVYDCIEFSPAYRCIDVASEVAFLEMDLEFRGRPDLGRLFVQTYNAVAEDPTLESMLPFYRSYRAMVRAKISALTSAAEEVAPAVRARAAENARALFDLADQYTLGMTPPRLVVLAGPTGVGKSSIARELQRRAGLCPLETDRIRKRLAGLDPDQPAPASFSKGIYTPAMTQATYRALGREALDRLQRGESALAVGTFLAREQREIVRDVAAKARTPLLFVRLSAPEAVIVERLTSRPAGMSDADVEVYRSMITREEQPDEISGSERLDLDTGAAAPAEVALAILERLRGSFENT
ncbi:MAG: AAA family ATPase [Acidobacteria bacterium]|nr:AAA family ATPase [Acidobacteriota bacterium]